MFTSLTPSWRSVVRRSRSHSPPARRAQVGLGDDLRQRRAAAVEVDDALVRAVNAPARAEVDQLRGVLLEVDTVDAYLAQPPARRTAARRTGRSDSPWGGRDRSSSCDGRSSAGRALSRARGRSSGRSARRARSRPAGCRAVQDRSDKCGCWETPRRKARSRRTSSWRSRAGHGSRGRSRPPSARAQTQTRAALPSKPIACSSACAASSSRFSLKAGPAICRPTGRPSLSPQGIEMAGIPASDIGTVQ